MGCCRRSAIEICLVIPIPSFAAALSGVSRGTCVQCRRVRFSVWTVASGGPDDVDDRRTPFCMLRFSSAQPRCTVQSRKTISGRQHSVVRSGQALSASPPTVHAGAVLPARSVGCRAGFVT